MTKSKSATKKANARKQTVAKKAIAAKVKAKATAKKATVTKIKIDRPVMTKTNAFFTAFKDNAIGVNRLEGKTDKSTASLGLAIDTNGYELLPLMEARPNATFATWYNGTKDCPENGYCNVFKTPEKKLHAQWDRTHAYINTLRELHTLQGIQKATGKEFRHLMQLIKQHCMYWQGDKQASAASNRAIAKKIPKKFKDALAGDYKKKKVVHGTSTVVAGENTLAKVRKNIKAAITSLGIMKGNLKDTEAGTIRAAHYSNLIDLLENVQQVDKDAK